MSMLSTWSARWNSLVRRLGLALVFAFCLIWAGAMVACSGAATSPASDGTGLTPTTSDAAAPSTDGPEPPLSGGQPAPRSSPGLFYDPALGAVILFGGDTDTSSYGDTWAYDPESNQWSELAPDGEVPEGRSMFALAYDSTREQAVLFGGGGMSEAFDDTWAYDPAANLWRESEPSGDLPPLRWATSAVYDPARDQVLLFGGSGLEGMLNDTWAYDPENETWSALDPSGGMPGPRGFLELVLDPESGTVILFGGGTEEDDFNDTWAYDPAGNRWMDLAPTGTVPTERSGYAVVYDSRAGRMILFGGFNATAEFNDTWAYDPATNRWTDLAPAGTLPSVRGFHAMVYDPQTGRVIMFGGFDGERYLNDTWTYDPATNEWIESIPATGEAMQARVRLRPRS
jgi:N-acetylneuraminic acid mutarotase